MMIGNKFVSLWRKDYEQQMHFTGDEIF